jgi:hypothetical protein
MVLQRAHRRRKRRSNDVKDRLIQTRVPERLESVLKDEAQKRRLTVSHLIRNMLEDTFDLVGSVVAGAGDIAKDSAAIAEQVAHDAGKIAATVRGAAKDAGKLANSVKEAVRSGTAAAEPRRPTADDELVGAPEPADLRPDRSGEAGLPNLGHILAWNQVVANQPVECAGCRAAIRRGGVAHLGISQNPGARPTWLCAGCLTRL